MAKSVVVFPRPVAGAREGALFPTTSSIPLPSTARLLPRRVLLGCRLSQQSGGRVSGRAECRSVPPEVGAAVVSASDEEEAAWRRRQEESKAAAEELGRSAGDSDSWRWTLNWDAITPDILVGSCPRSAADIDTIVEKAGITAVVNLQSDVCLDALQIPFAEIKQRSIERGVFLARVPVRDFDHQDQATMLPEAVRVVNVLVTMGHKVYLHCTAGINRATLVAMAYLYFIKGCRRDEALKMVKQARSIANPYLDCLTEAKRRLLEGRDEELTSLATEIYEQRMSGEGRGDASSDWSGAQARALSRSFAKFLEVDLGMLETEKAILQRRWLLEGSKAPLLSDALQAQLDGARALVNEQKAKISQLRAVIEAWEREESASEARAEELKLALERAKHATPPAAVKPSQAGNTKPKAVKSQAGVNGAAFVQAKKPASAS